MTEPNVMTVQHVNIMVDDLPAADHFYAEVLGLDRMPTPDLGMPAQFFRFNEMQELHVNQLEDARPERAHFCVRVDNFNELFGKAQQLGIIETETWGKARRLPSGVMQLFVRDPAGNLIEIACDADQHVDPSIFDLDFVESEQEFFTQPDKPAST
ncbi:MAG: VOC family protein [Acidimicrobiales bacterium]